MSISPATTVGDLVSDRIGRIEVLERYGIDYCCGGRRTLDAACRESGRAPEEVVAALEAADRDAAAAEEPDPTDWRAASLTELTEHITATHHDFMKRELPRIGDLMEKVLGAHRANHPELVEVAMVFAALRSEIEGHLAKEEQVLFPLIREMEATGEAGRAHCGSVNNPIMVMEREHDNAGVALERLRALTGGYVAPADGCASYRALLAALAAMEHDLHEHIHKENNILHPRAARFEASLLESARRES